MMNLMRQAYDVFMPTVAATLFLGLVIGTQNSFASENHLTDGYGNHITDGHGRHITHGEGRHETQGANKRHETQDDNKRHETQGGEKRHATD